MATTSLARQLEQLRASTVNPDFQKQSVAQQGPNILSAQLSVEQLTLLAKDAFAQICDICPTVFQFKSKVFSGDQVRPVTHLSIFCMGFRVFRFCGHFLIAVSNP